MPDDARVAEAVDAAGGMTVTIGGPTPAKVCGTCGAVGEYPGFGGRPCPKCLAAEEDAT